MESSNKTQTSGLSSKLKAKQLNPNTIQSQEDNNNQKKYIFYLDITIPEKIQTPKVEIAIPITMKVSQAIELALNQFKQQLKVIGVLVNNNRILYNARLSKKNGKAKTDMPSLDVDQILSQIKISSISLQIKEDSAVILESKFEDKIQSRLPITNIQQQQSITNEIGYSKKENKEISQVLDQPEKPNSGCFFSFC